MEAKLRAGVAMNGAGGEAQCAQEWRLLHLTFKPDRVPEFRSGDIGANAV